MAPAPGESSCEGCDLQMTEHCTEFVDLDNWNSVVPETVFKRSTLVYIQGQRATLSAIHLQIDQKKMCVYICGKC